jgi:ATP-dependent DNA ligase
VITHKDLALPTSAAKPFDRSGWLFELKYDGFRVLARRHGEDADMISRRGNDLLPRFPEIAAELVRLPDLVLDGELVMLDLTGLSQFEPLRRRAVMRYEHRIRDAAVRSPAAIFAFDVLELRGQDLRYHPLLARKAALADVLERSVRIRPVTYVLDQGQALHAAAEKHGAEGIVAKRTDSSYQSGRYHAWLTIKTSHGRHIGEARADWNK